MKAKLEKLRDLASDAASVANHGFSSAKEVAGRASSAALAAGKIEKLRDLASDVASVANHGLSSAKEVAGRASSAAFAAGKSGQQIIGKVIEHEDTKAAVAKAKEFSVSASTEAKRLTSHVADKVKEADANHKEIADKVETVSMGLGITSGIAAAGAALAAPTGVSAIGLALGITTAPLIVTAAPVLCAASTVTGVISGGAYFYSKWKTSKEKKDSEQE